MNYRNLATGICAVCIPEDWSQKVSRCVYCDGVATGSDTGGHPICSPCWEAGEDGWSEGTSR